MLVLIFHGEFAGRPEAAQPLREAQRVAHRVVHEVPIRDDAEAGEQEHSRSLHQAAAHRHGIKIKEKFALRYAKRHFLSRGYMARSVGLDEERAIREKPAGASRLSFDSWKPPNLFGGGGHYNPEQHLNLGSHM
jgi:hypothetical protein